MVGLQKRYQVFDEVHYVASGKFRRYYGEGLRAHLKDVRTLLLNGRDFFKVLRGIVSAYRLLRKIRPTVVFAKGGFVVVPVGIAARLLGIPIVTHDSDALPGLANRIVGRWAITHTTGMPAEHYRYPKATTHYVGIPVDERIKPVNDSAQAEFKKQLNIRPTDPLLLIGGAGLGARDVNNLILEVAPELLTQLPELQIIHITGTAHHSAVVAKYHELLNLDQQARVTILDFSDDFYKYASAADLIITRAGATTIAELAVAAKACILIPAPQLPGGHQLKNAQVLKQLGAAEVLSNDVKTEKLLELVVQLLGSDQKRQALAQNLAKLAKPDAAIKIAEVLLAVGEEKKPST